MPDKYNRLTASDRRSAALFGLAPFAGCAWQLYEENDWGLRLKVRVALRANAGAKEIAEVLGITQDQADTIIRRVLNGTIW